MEFVLTYHNRKYYVNGKEINSDSGTVVYYLRHMCKIPAHKRPTCAVLIEHCIAARELCGLPVVITV